MGFVGIMLYTVQHMRFKIWIKHKLMKEIMFIVLFINKTNIYFSLLQYPNND